LNPLGAVYGRVAGLRRRWYARHPERRRTLGVPVISVGNLVVGGSGKTPVTAALARLLLDAGERPAILSRGYRRRTRADEVVVVSDGARVLTSVQNSGDEPQMLARILDGVPVVVCARRYRAGEVAVSRFGATVLLLDDGFQHLQLARDVDLLIVAPGDLDEQVLPVGSLRESLDAGGMADAVLVPAPHDEAQRIATVLGVERAFAIEARYEPVRDVAGVSAPGTLMADPGFQIPDPRSAIPDSGSRAIAVSGIARPQRFFDAVRALGWDVAEQMVFPDHHWFDERDVARVESAAGAAGATAVITTEKDAVRLADVNRTMTWVYVPLRVTLTPDEQFRIWMVDRLRQARERIATGTTADR
jgi:tetraacyldisaccharide 4'-kinase